MKNGRIALSLRKMRKNRLHSLEKRKITALFTLKVNILLWGTEVPVVASNAPPHCRLHYLCAKKRENRLHSLENIKFSFVFHSFALSLQGKIKHDIYEFIK